MEWQPYRLGSARRGGLTGTTGRILAGATFPCVYCHGTGNQLHMRSKCPVCRGKGSIKVNPPAVICVFCQGTGESPPRSHLTCPACRGKGVMSIKEPIERCDACRGLGRVDGTQLPCIKCRGAGVVTIKRTDRSKERKGGGTMEVKPRVTPDALARLEIAREKARIMGKKPTAVSELEQAAEKWKEEKELRQAQLTYRERDDSPIAIASVPLLRVMDKGRRDEEIIWKQRRLHPEERPRQIKMNAAMICTIAQHLRAREWARALGKTKGQQGDGYDLEKAAEHWKRQKELEKRGILGKNQRSTSR